MYIDTYIRGCSIQQCSASAVVATVTAGALSFSLIAFLPCSLMFLSPVRHRLAKSTLYLRNSLFTTTATAPAKSAALVTAGASLFGLNNALKHLRCWLMPSVVSCCLSTQMTLVLNSVAAVAVTNTTCTQFTLSAQSTPLNLMTR